MTDKLPPNLLALFAPRPPLRYIPPSDRAPDDIKKSTISGVAQFLDDLKKYDEEVPYHPTESWLQRKARLKAEKKEKLEHYLTEEVKNCTYSVFSNRYHLLDKFMLTYCFQMTLPRTRRFAETRSRLSLLHVSVTT